MQVIARREPMPHLHPAPSDEGACAEQFPWEQLFAIAGVSDDLAQRPARRLGVALGDDDAIQPDRRPQSVHRSRPE